MPRRIAVGYRRKRGAVSPFFFLETCSCAAGGLQGAGKEYIGDDIDEMVGACKQAITQCALQLKSKITRVQAAREQRNRKKALQKYIPNAAAAIYTVCPRPARAMHRPPTH